MCVHVYARYKTPKCLPHVIVKKNNHQFENLCCYVLIYGFVVIINLWLRREQGSRSYSIRSVGKRRGERERDSGKDPWTRGGKRERREKVH